MGGIGGRGRIGGCAIGGGLLIFLAAQAAVTSPPAAAGTTTTTTGPGFSQQPSPGYNPNSDPYPSADTTTRVAIGRSTPVASIVGPAAPGSSSPVLGAVIDAWQTMDWTIYSHHDVVDATAGTYRFDCVGMTNYFLSVGAPAANQAMRSELGIGKHYVPRPAAMANYFAALPIKGNGSWTPVRQITAIRGGDIIAVPPKPGTSQSGHALVAAGTPLLLANGDYALLVYDSTATPHGPADTRLTDPHNRPLPPTATRPYPRASGLGSGTIELKPSPTGSPSAMYWSIDGPAYGARLQIARPTSQ
jgi:hypothetical protein